jgi:hypothetical protein
MHMISKLWRTLCTGMGLVSQSVHTNPTLVMMKKNSFVGKLIIFDTWVTSSVDCFASFHHSMLYFFWPIIFNFTSLHQNMFYNPVSNFKWSETLFLTFKNWFLIFKHMDVIHAYLIPYNFSMEMRYKRVSERCSL